MTGRQALRWLIFCCIYAGSALVAFAVMYLTEWKSLAGLAYIVSVVALL